MLHITSQCLVSSALFYFPIVYFTCDISGQLSTSFVHSFNIQKLFVQPSLFLCQPLVSCIFSVIIFVLYSNFGKHLGLLLIFCLVYLLHLSCRVTILLSFLCKNVIPLRERCQQCGVIPALDLLFVLGVTNHTRGFLLTLLRMPHVQCIIPPMTRHTIRHPLQQYITLV